MITNDELKRIRKEVSVAYFKVLSKNLSAKADKRNEKLVVKIADTWDF
jgi:hypothetical protein